MSNRLIFFEKDSQKVFHVEYRLEIIKDGVVLITKTATVEVVTKGDAIAAAVQAKIEALEKIPKEAGDISFRVSNVLFQGEREA